MQLNILIQVKCDYMNEINILYKKKYYDVRTFKDE